jgi:hypothetical protein
MPFVPLTPGQRPQAPAPADGLQAQPPTAAGRFVPLMAPAAPPVATAAEPVDAPERTWSELATDTAIDAGKGVVGLGESVVGLADLATGNLVGKGLGAVGYDPERTKQALSEGYSDSRKAANKAVQDAKGFWDTTLALASNPSAAFGSVVESAPLMLGSAAAARGLAMRMLASRGIAPGTEAAAKFLSQPSVVAKLTAASSGAEGAMTAGSIQESGRQAGRDYTDTAGHALAAGATTAGIGFLTSKIPGFRDVEAKAATAGMGAAGGAGATVKEAAKALAKDTFKEGVLEELPQSAQEQVWQNLALGKPWDDGVAEAAAQGMVAGAGMGGGMSAYSSGVDALRASKAEGQPAAAAADPTPAATGSAPRDAVPDNEPAAADAATAALQAPPADLTALDRVQAIDAEISAAPAGADTAALQAERAALSKDWPALVPGAPTTFSTEAGASLEGQYALVEAEDMQPSHDTNLRPNPAYPQSLQPRQRDRAASATQIQSIVGRLDPARLGESATAADGAPIIGADGLVESGNARTIALRRVYAANGLKAQQYRTWLSENADRFGLAAEQIEGMRNPVLVRVRSTPVNRAEFARQANAPTVAAMSPREQALSDAARIDTLDDLNPTDTGEFTNSRDFIRRFVGTLPQTERGAAIDADGGLSAAGYARVRNAVLAKAYGDSPVLTRLVESMDDTGRNIARALVMAAPRVAQVKALAEAGRRHPADITPALVEAAGELERLRQSGQSVGEALGQQAIDGQGRSPEAAKLLGFMAENARRPRRIADLLTAYADALDAAGDPAQASLLGGDQAPTVGALLDGALRQVQEPAAPTAAPTAANDPTGPDWVGFAPESGTLGIPRSQMPQVKMADRGAMVNFLKARGIEHEIVEVDPASLKPTQAEFSRKKTKRAMEAAGDTATALVSADGYVIDGHHRWLAQRVKGDTLRALRFNAPAEQVLEAIHAFPSTTTSGESAADPRRAAVQDFKDALADLGDFLTRHQRAALVGEKAPDLQKILVNLCEKGIKLIGTDLKRLTAWVRQQLKADPKTRKHWNKVSTEQYRQAAQEALRKVEQGGAQRGLFDDEAAATDAVQGDLFAGAPAAQPAAPAPSASLMQITDFKEAEHLPADAIAQAKADVQRLQTGDAPKQTITAEERAQAEALMAPMLQTANDQKPVFDDKVAEIARVSGAIGYLLAPIKSIGRSAEKLVLDNGMQADKMRDLLRSTIVVSSYADAQRVLDTIYKRFEVSPGRVKNRTPASLKAPDLTGDPGLLGSGYGDVLVNVKIGGIEAEILINIPEMIAAKEGQGHKLYDIERVMPAGSDAALEVIAAQRVFYGAASAAASLRQEASDKGIASEDGGQRRALTSSPPTRLKGPSDGISTASMPESDSKNLEPSGNLSGTFTSSPPSDSILSQNSATSDNRDNEGGRDGTDPADGNAGQGPAGAGAEVPGGSGRQGRAAGVPAGGRGPGQPGRGDGVGAGELAGDGQGAAVPAEGASDEQRGPERPRGRARAGGGEPAGRTIRPKSGLNYRFTDADISPPGSWAKRAEWNVEAVELVKALAAENRKATREEQATLAKFVGWGASEIANNLFGDKLNKVKAMLPAFDRALAAVDKAGGTLRRDRWARYGGTPDGWFDAFEVLRKADPKLSWNDLTEITADGWRCATASRPR